ncbi:hypothetical protein MBLNU13_g04620t1 [Cladosporium sp. NU13]
MYRTNDPRFRRRLNDLSATLESANESAQSSVYIFTQHYIRPCFGSIGNCLTTCVEAGCPHLQRRDRLRRGRRGRAELSFDFYDDWDEDENEGLLGWGDDDGDAPGYGAVDVQQQQQQPARQRGMSYPRDRRRKSAHEGAAGTEGLGGSGFFGRLFGGSRAVRYKPSSADLQDHPGAKRSHKDRGEGEALLEESEGSVGADRAPRKHGRNRSGTAGSRETMDSLSSRGDIFPSDEEDDAIPLDDEFAMVLERRNTQSGPETETSSGNTGSIAPTKRGKRPSAGSRVSSRRTMSSRSLSGKGSRSRNTSAAQTPMESSLQGGFEELSAKEIEVPTMDDLSEEERELAKKEEAEIERRRDEASRAAAERGLADAQRKIQEDEAVSQAKEEDETSPSQAKQETVDHTREPTTAASPASEVPPPKAGSETNE